MKIYHYRATNGEFIFESEARRDPLELGRFLVPANATTIAPPTVAPNQVAVWSGSAWTVAVDYRGAYYDYDRNLVTIDEIGVEIPAGWTVEPREDTAEEALEKAKAAIAAQRYAVEVGGVVDPVSGMTIPTDRESQQILDSTLEKIRRGLIPAVQWKCADGWLTLDASNIDAIELLVLTHVQTAFAWEKAQVDAL